MIGSMASQEGVLIGKIKTDAVIKGSLAIPVGYEDYAGSYDIRPNVNEQIIPTADKHMTQDVTIQAIPFFKTTNPQGGETIIIGG